LPPNIPKQYACQVFNYRKTDEKQQKKQQKPTKTNEKQRKTTKNNQKQPKTTKANKKNVTE